MSSFWRNFNHWLHWKLSFWQLPVQPVMKISSKWRHFRFSGDDCMMTSSNGNISALLAICARSPVNSPQKGQWRGALMFSLISAWINSWVNNRETGDLRRHRARYNVIVMNIDSVYPLWFACKTPFLYGFHKAHLGLVPHVLLIRRSRNGLLLIDSRLLHEAKQT